MTLVGSGILYLGQTASLDRNIRAEILGNVGIYNLKAASTAASKDPLPTTMRNFYNYNHSPNPFGRMYGANEWNTPSFATLVRFNEGSEYEMSVAETLEFTANQDESTYCEAASGVAFTLGDSCGAILYRRAKFTTDPWVIADSTYQLSYLSQTIICVFSTYDYKWELFDAV